MRKIKFFFLIFIIFISVIFILGPETLPENLNPQEILALAENKDVIIVFNSGGWGNTPLEKAKDFSPIIEGIQEILGNLGYDSLVIHFNRTKASFFGFITSIKDSANSYDLSSKILAEDLSIITEKDPDKKIILAGLSNGAAFVNETYERISQNNGNKIYAIAIGPPFWSEKVGFDNTLQLNNEGEDSLFRGSIASLTFSLIETPFRWLFSKFTGQNLSLARAFKASGHEYNWSSSDVGPEISAFLETKFASLR